MDTKQCTKCQEVKPFDGFYTYPNGRFHSACKACYAAHRKAYTSTETGKAAMRRNYMNTKSQRQTYAIAHAEKIKEYQREYRQKNAEKIKEYLREYYAKYVKKQPG